MQKTHVLLILALLALPATVAAQSVERAGRDRIAFTTDATLVQGCALLGRVKDDDVKDLRRKIQKLGGDTAVVAFGTEDIVADVYRCPPPPPAGPPPPPPR